MMNISNGFAGLRMLMGEHSKLELKALLTLKNDEHFRKSYLKPALEDEVIEMTQPNSPNSPTQKYRLTTKGKQELNAKLNKRVG